MCAVFQPFSRGCSKYLLFRLWTGGKNLTLVRRKYVFFIHLVLSHLCGGAGRPEVLAEVPDHVEAAGQHAAEVRGRAHHDAGPTLTTASRLLRYTHGRSQGGQYRYII